MIIIIIKASTTHERKYSKMDQIKFIENSLQKI